MAMASALHMKKHCMPSLRSFFFFNDTATTEIYTLSLHDALPISTTRAAGSASKLASAASSSATIVRDSALRSEEHTSELQSQSNLVCRLLLEKKKKDKITDAPFHLFSTRCHPVLVIVSSRALDIT